MGVKFCPFLKTMLDLLIALSYIIVSSPNIVGKELNVTTATCFDPTLVGAVNLFKEWPAYRDDGSDGYCYDSQGKGYKPGQTYLSCMGCMRYVCVSHPCSGDDGDGGDGGDGDGG